MTDFTPTAAQLKALDLLASKSTHCALGGGARSGKTFWLIRAVILRAQLAPGSRHAVFRFRGNAVNAAIVEDTFPKVMKLCFPEGFYDLKGWTKSPNLYYEFGNGSQVWFAGLDDKERVEKILGMEFVTLYFNECSQIPWGSVVTAKTRLAQKVMVPKGNGTLEREMAPKCYYDFNPPSKRHWTYLQFVEKKQPENKQPVIDPFDYGFQFMNPESNLANLSSKFIQQLESLPPKARERFLMGKFADDSEGALWTDELIHQNRRSDHPPFIRIIIAVDPSGCSGEEDFRSDEVGITVWGLGTDGHGYLLEDLSGRFSPNQWARIVNNAYERHAADKVVAERNYGGEMVKAVLQAENPELPVGLVTATRGKVVRAEPVSALYEAGKIHHCGYFPELEDQLCSFTMAGYQGMKSPDRADSGVWGVTELFPGIAAKAEGVWRPPSIITRKRSASRYDSR